MKDKATQQKGFTLIEVAVCVGILSVVMLGSLALNDNMNHSITNFKRSSSRTSFEMQALSALTQPQVCACNLREIDLSSAAGTETVLDKLTTSSLNCGASSSGDLYTRSSNG